MGVDKALPCLLSQEAGEGKDSKGNVLDYGTMLQRAHEAAAAVAQ